MPEEMKEHHRRVHMANERTFLAWIRTGLALMAFGFVVERFSLFMRQLSYIISQGRPGGQAELPHATGYSGVLGIVLVGLGALMGFLAFIRYKNIERQIDSETYRPSFLLDLLLVTVIAAVGAFLVFYLLKSI